MWEKDKERERETEVISSWPNFSVDVQDTQFTGWRLICSQEGAWIYQVKGLILKLIYHFIY